MRLLLHALHGGAVCLEGAAIVLATVPTALAMLLDGLRVWARDRLERL